ncbi:MAG: hypothetical protein ACRDZ4_01680 [Egibacteraceae bacterium]
MANTAQTTTVFDPGPYGRGQAQSALLGEGGGHVRTHVVGHGEHPDRDAVERGEANVVSSPIRVAHGERPGLAAGPANTASPTVLSHRQALSGRRRLIDRRMPTGEDALLWAHQPTFPARTCAIDACTSTRLQLRVVH